MKVFRSQDVAEMLGKRHDNLLRAIRKYIVALGDEATDYFIPDKGERGSVSYKVTYKGCELLGGRLIGKAGAEFKSWYQQLGNSEEAEPEKVDEPVVKEFTVQEVAELLGISGRSVYRNIQAGKLESVEREVMIPTLKKFITEEALEDFKAKREVS